jgi:hypothetical protein
MFSFLLDEWKLAALLAVGCWLLAVGRGEKLPRKP